MENADFKIHLPKTNNTSYGNEGVEFLISSNKGSDYSLINKIASGGELSRICLAMLVELTKKQTVLRLFLMRLIMESVEKLQKKLVV